MMTNRNADLEHKGVFLLGKIEVKVRRHLATLKT